MTIHSDLLVYVGNGHQWWLHLPPNCGCTTSSIASKRPVPDGQTSNAVDCHPMKDQFLADRTTLMMHMHIHRLARRSSSHSTQMYYPYPTDTQQKHRTRHFSSSLHRSLPISSIRCQQCSCQSLSQVSYRSQERNADVGQGCLITYSSHTMVRLTTLSQPLPSEVLISGVN